jgi:hypothetical protein
MGRKVLAVITAMITAVAIIWVAFMIATMIAPTTPSQLEYVRNADLAAYMQTYPPSSFVAVLVGYALAAFAGGFVATKMGRRWSPGLTLALIVGVLLTIGSLMTANVWPQPVWFIIAGAVIFVPLALLGYRTAR